MLRTFDFVGRAKYFIAISVALIVSIFVLLFFKGINLGIDFTGGMLIEIKSPNVTQHIAKYRDKISQSGYKGVAIQGFGDDGLMIRLKLQGTENQKHQTQKIRALIVSIDTDVDFRKFEYVGPKVGGALIKDSILAIIIAMVAISIYIWLRFQLIYGIGAILALLHDIIMVLGFFAISRYEFDVTSVASVLTILGYSINDTVVIYDRIRENTKKYSSHGFDFIFNKSINDTMSRTIITSGTTMLACISLAIFASGAIKVFGLAVFFGVLFGTYSSIYISSPILMYLPIKSLTKTT